MKKQLIALFCAIYSASVFSADLLQVYQDAVLKDPILEQAKFQSLSNQTALPLSINQWMPQLNFNGNIARQRVLTGLNDPAAAAFIPARQTFNSSNYTLALSQQVFNIQEWLAISSAKATVKEAQATYNAAVQNLIVRTAAAYFNILQARDNLTFVSSRNAANKRQLEDAKQRFKVGLEPITTVYDAQAAYDNSTADEIAAKIALQNAETALINLTNRTYDKIEGLAQELPLIPPTPKNADQWVQGALKQNYSIQAAHYSAVVARKNIKIQGMGNMPVLSANLNYNNTTTNSQGFASGYVETNQANLTAAWPIFDGGTTITKTSKAKYDYQVAMDVFEQTYRGVEVNTRQTFNKVLSGIRKIEADREAVKSAQLALESTDAQYKAGTRTIVDVLLAQQNLFSAQTTLASDQYLYINSTLQLKELAGTLAPSDLMMINDILHKKPKKSKKPEKSETK